MMNRRTRNINNRKQKVKKEKKSKIVSKVCIVCRAEKTKEEFTNTQFKKQNGRCQECIMNPPRIQPQQSQQPGMSKTLAETQLENVNTVEPSITKEQEMNPNPSPMFQNVNINGMIAK